MYVALNSSNRVTLVRQPRHLGVHVNCHILQTPQQDLKQHSAPRHSSFTAITTLFVPNRNNIHIRYSVATTLPSCTVSSSAPLGLRLWRSAIPFVVFRRANPLGPSCRRHHHRRLHRQWLHPAKKKFPRRLIIGSKTPLKFILQILLIAWRQNSISPKPKAN